MVVALMVGVLLLVSTIVLNRLDTYLEGQEVEALSTRALEVGSIVAVVAAPASGSDPVIGIDNTLNATVSERINSPSFLSFLANTVAKSDVTITIGPTSGGDGSGPLALTSLPGSTVTLPLNTAPDPREAREPISDTEIFGPVQTGSALSVPWGVQVTLANPYTTRAYTVLTIEAILLITDLAALLVVLLISLLIAAQFTAPLRRLSEAMRRFGAGNLAHRAPIERWAYTEVTDLAGQFNLTAGRLEESVNLVRRDRDRGREFLADVSHELRTPITAMRMNTEILQGPAGESADTRAEFLELSRSQLERLDWMAQNLLELSKLESGLLELDLSPDDLRTTVESAVEATELVARRRGVNLIRELPEAPLQIHHDPPRIGQVVGNLVGNALKFTPRGGTVRVSLRPHPEGAELEVADDGAGIEVSELPHIFERFYRGTNANEVRSSGSGLGLAIVKSIIEMHGGRIEVTSQLGVGTTFRVILPRDPGSSSVRAGDG
jgi:signal transduction histidine kinase